MLEFPEETYQYHSISKTLLQLLNGMIDSLKNSLNNSFTKVSDLVQFTDSE